jgi:hypothetical protein
MPGAGLLSVRAAVLRRFVAAPTGHFGQPLVGGFLLIQNFLQKFGGLIVAELFGPFTQAAV